MNFIKELLDTKNCVIEEANIKGSDNEIYWHCTILNNKSIPIGSGFSNDRNLSRKIAVAEYLEDTQYQSICNSTEQEKENWGLNKISTGCGFAAGFEVKMTQLRSVAEAVEKWALSKWIDEGYVLKVNESASILSESAYATKYFSDFFDKTSFFEKELIVPFENKLLTIYLGVAVSELNNGIFIGSSAGYQKKHIWQHSLLECFRNYQVSSQPIKVSEFYFPENKIRFFAQNRNIAIEQIQKANKLDWPMPKIILHRVQGFESDQYFLARTIIDGWKSWDEGPIERFLY